jgi:hypothetical protein
MRRFGAILLVLALVCIALPMAAAADGLPVISFYGGELKSGEYYGTYVYSSFSLWFKSDTAGFSFTPGDVVATVGNTSLFAVQGVGIPSSEGGRDGAVMLNSKGKTGITNLTVRSKSNKFAPLTTRIGVISGVEGFSLLTTRVEKNGNVAYVKRGKSLKLYTYAYSPVLGDDDYASPYPIAGSRFKWKSSAKSVATVSKSGTVKVKKNAKAGKYTTITATYRTEVEGKKKTLTVKYKIYAAGKAGKVSKLTRIGPATVDIVAGNSVAAGFYNVKFKGTALNTVKYKSSNTAVATVNSLGLVKAKKAGTVKITLSCGGKKFTRTLNVLTPQQWVNGD